jgi:putative ABC transport system permease protein
LPEVRSAGAVYERPFEPGPIGMDSGVLLEGQADTPDVTNRNGVVNWESVTSHYFSSMGVRLLRGRIFDERDTATADHTTVVSEAAANHLWPGQDPLGKRLRLSVTESADRWLTVVGVVATARYREIDNPRFDLYVPLRQSTSDVQHFTVRTTGDPLAATPAIDAAIKHVDPRLSIGGVTTMDAVVRRVRGPWHFTLIVFAAFGLIALALAVVGLFAVVSYAVTRRSREIGVRMALGATPGRVVRLIVVQGAGPAAPGRLAGPAVRRTHTRKRQPLHFRVSAGDPLTMALTLTFFGVVIVTASYLPARRAGRVDPQLALRQD